MFYQLTVSFVLITIFVIINHYNVVNASSETGERIEDFCKAVEFRNCSNSMIKELCPNRCAIAVALFAASESYAKTSSNLQNINSEKEYMQSEGGYPNFSKSNPIIEEWCDDIVKLEDCQNHKVKNACHKKCKTNKTIDEKWCQYGVDNIKDCEEPQTHRACPAICKSKGFRVDEPWCRLVVQLAECEHKQILEQCPNLCSNSLSNTCGEIRVTDRVVNGQHTEVNEYPWVVGIFIRYAYVCGGSLLNTKWVLTASHCFRRGLVNDFLLTLGEHDLRTDDETDNILRNISRVIMHKYFDSPIDYANDIALVLLTNPVEFSAIVSPVCFPTRDKDYDDVDAIVTGWGSLIYGDPGADILQEAIVHTMPTWMCRKSRSRNWLYRVIRKDWICASASMGGEGEDACQGDSGGPLMLVEDGHYVQIGVVSWGNGCGMKNNPGVYTRVTEYIDWIKKNTNDESQCKEDSHAICHNRLPSDVRQSDPNSKKFNEI